MNPLLIAGAKASGKSIVRGILDGHPEVFASPFHELLTLGFDLSVKNHDGLENRDIQWLRESVLTKTKYHQLERMARQGHCYLDLGNGLPERINFEFDFYRFDKQWVDDLFQQESWNVGMVLSALARNFRDHFKFPRLDRDSHLFATCSDGFSSTLTSFFDAFDSGKMIFVKREIKDVIGALCCRSKVPGDFRSRHFSRRTALETYLTKDFVETTAALFATATELKKRYPDNVLLLNFDEVFDDPDRIIFQIRDFLDISNAESLSEFTVLGKQIGLNNERLDPLRVHQDESYNLLSIYELESLERILESCGQS